MTGSALGGGVIFVVAAILWTVVLVPAWVRRREFRVSERNAIRLQRTLRVLAETAEVPEEVRVEATARQALAHEKLMHTARKRQEAERAAELAKARAAQVRAEAHAKTMQRKQVAERRSARLRRPAMRRVRVLIASTTVLAVLGTLIGVGLLLAGAGGALLGWALLASVGGVGSLIALAPGQPALATSSEVAAAEEPEEHTVEESPQLQGSSGLSAAQHAAAQQAAAARIARARALARSRAERPAERVNQPDSMLLAEEQRRRDQRVAPTPVAADAAPASEQAERAIAHRPAPESPAQVAARSQQLAVSARLRTMGVVGDTSEGLPDLDEALRRRRNAG